MGKTLADFIREEAEKNPLINNLQNQEISAEDLEAISNAANLYDKIVAVIKTVYDPEIPVNLWDLGLIYKLEIGKNHDIVIEMTLTTPSCPVAGAIPVEVEKRIAQFVSGHNIKVNLVWEPMWNKQMMSEEAKMILDMW